MTIHIAIILPFVLWIAFRLILAPGPYEMDQGPSDAMGTFFALLPHWQRLFFAVGIAAGAAGVWSFHLGEKQPAFLLALAVLNALAFNGWMVLNYEAYLASRYPRDGSQGKSSYSIGRYALSLAFGVSAFLLLVVGVIMAVWGLV